VCDLPHCLVGIEACPSAHHFGRLASGGARRNSFYPLEWGICFSKGLPRSIADNARRLIEGVLSPQQHPIARYGDGSCRYSSRCASVRVVLPRSPPARWRGPEGSPRRLQRHSRSNASCLLQEELGAIRVRVSRQLGHTGQRKARVQAFKVALPCRCLRRPSIACFTCPICGRLRGSFVLHRTNDGGEYGSACTAGNRL
jgi:hypothetical protein